MKIKSKRAWKLIAIVFVLSVFSNLTSIAQTKSTDNKTKTAEIKYKATFIELGSVRCKPCQQMQPVIKAIEEKYSTQVKVVFYDVWTPEGKEKSKNFDFNEIPTQLFLDSEGKEYYRHTGFFSEEEVLKVLKQKGVK